MSSGSSVTVRPSGVGYGGGDERESGGNRILDNLSLCARVAGNLTDGCANSVFADKPFMD